jgi:hypothetical protein
LVVGLREEKRGREVGDRITETLLSMVTAPLDQDLSQPSRHLLRPKDLETFTHTHTPPVVGHLDAERW